MKMASIGRRVDAKLQELAGRGADLSTFGSALRRQDRQDALDTCWAGIEAERQRALELYRKAKREEGE
jgi:hypothetical protein